MIEMFCLDKIEQIKNENINNLKILLANETTSMLHGKSMTVKAELTAKNTFEKRSVGDDLPIFNINKNDLSNGINIVELVVKAKLLNSKSEVRRTIINKGIKLNNETVENDKFNVSINNFNNDKILKLSHGKKKHVILKLN